MTARWPIPSHQVACRRRLAGLGQFLANSGRLRGGFCDWPGRIFVRQLRHLGRFSGGRGGNSSHFTGGSGVERPPLKAEREIRQRLTPETRAEAPLLATLANFRPTPLGATDGTPDHT